MSLAAALLVALALWLFRRDRPRDAPPPEATPPAGTANEGQPAARARSRPFAAPPVAPADATSTIPIIDEITVEKPEVCEGEENTITVRAHTANQAGDAYLRTMIGGRAGSTLVVRGSRDPGAQAGLKALVFGRDGTPVTAEVPRFTVKDCKAGYQLHLSYRLLANRASAFELAARLDRFGATRAFEAVRYHWWFGDGATAETTAPLATHDFSRRPQETLTSTFLVRCRAISRSGDEVVGQTALALNNLAFESFVQKGVVKILAETDPLFPVAAADGSIRERVRLWHPYGRAVRIDRLRRTKLALGAVAAAPDSLPASVLGIAAIAPGETVTSKAFTLDPGAEPQVYSIEYLIEGTTEDGWPAMGNFALMRPPPPPTREHHTPVGDPVLKAKILRAREMLGKDLVTDEDIWRLEREGRLADVELAPPPAGAPANPATPPPVRPPTPRPTGH